MERSEDDDDVSECLGFQANIRIFISFHTLNRLPIPSLSLSIPLAPDQFPLRLLHFLLPSTSFSSCSEYCYSYRILLVFFRFFTYFSGIPSSFHISPRIMSVPCGRIKELVSNVQLISFRLFLSESWQQKGWKGSLSAEAWFLKLSMYLLQTYIVSTASFKSLAAY